MATQLEVAEHLDVTDRQVRSLLTSGVLPGSKGRGGYDLDDCRMAYIRNLRGQASGQVKSPEAEPDSDAIDPMLEQKSRVLADPITPAMGRRNPGAGHFSCIPGRSTTGASKPAVAPPASVSRCASVPLRRHRDVQVKPWAK